MSREELCRRIVADVEANNGPMLLDLVGRVCPGSDLPQEEIVATVWDLVQEDVLDYGADGRVVLAKQPQPEKTS